MHLFASPATFIEHKAKMMCDGGILVGIKVFLSAILCLTGVAMLQGETILVESESLKSRGSWVLDSQFVDQMGSPFLLAHGLGKPCDDAETVFNAAEAGKYKVFVRTRNWAAKWTEKAPGTFKLIINGKPLPAVFGNESGQWAWQKGGEVELKKGENTLALRDLTGFDGRCDAVIFSSDPLFVPPEKKGELDAFRKLHRSISHSGKTEKADFIVVGGGVAGVCAAISASRLGLQTILIHDRPVPGGNNSSEVRVHLGGKIKLPPYDKLGDVLAEIGPAKGGNARHGANYEDERKINALAAEKNLKVFYNTRVIDADCRDGKIVSVTGRNMENGVETNFEAPLFLDSTGDGNLGVLAGADYRYGRESKEESGETYSPEKSDRMTMGASVQYYSVKSPAPVSFPDIDWGLPFNDESCEKLRRGDWTWETGMFTDQIDDFETIRDYGLYVVFSNWSYLKNRYAKKADFANDKLEWVAYVAGKRESRRLLGDVILTSTDIHNGKVYPDGTCHTTWSIDLHYPDPENTKHFPGREFKSIAVQDNIKPYQIPYRCLYSRNVNNMFMAGRNISVTHAALGTVRVMRTTGMMGEVVGMAAKICHDKNVLPRDIYPAHFEELREMMKKGVGNGQPQPPQKYNGG